MHPSLEWGLTVYTGPTTGAERQQTENERLLCALADTLKACNDAYGVVDIDIKNDNKE